MVAGLPGERRQSRRGHGPRVASATVGAPARRRRTGPQQGEQHSGGGSMARRVNCGAGDERARWCWDRKARGRAAREWESASVADPATGKRKVEEKVLTFGAGDRAARLEVVRRGGGWGRAASWCGSSDGARRRGSAREAAPGAGDDDERRRAWRGVGGGGFWRGSGNGGGSRGTMTGGGEVASAGEATGRRPAMVLGARGAQIGERGRGLDRGIVREGIRVSGVWGGL